jgi:hypothetical protein
LGCAASVLVESRRLCLLCAGDSQSWGRFSGGIMRIPLHCARARTLARRLLVWAALGVRMTEDLDSLGVEAGDVRPDSTGRNVVIGVIGLLLVIGALVPLTIGAIWVGSLVYAGVVSFVNGSPVVPVP